MISIKNTSASAGMHSFREFFLDDLATSRAALGRVAWINLDRQLTSVLSFVGCVSHKLIPCRVTDAFGKAVVSHHVLDRQVFERDEVVFVYQLPAELVRKVCTSIRSAFVDARDNPTRLASGQTSFHLRRKFTLCFGEIVLIVAKESRIVDLLAGAKCRKGSQSNIDPDLLPSFGQRDGFGFADNQHKPLARTVGKGHCFDLAFGRSVEDCLNVADELKVTGKSFNLAPITVGRIFNGLELPHAFEPWEASLLAGLHAAKECLIRLVQSAQRRLQAGIVGVGNVLVSTRPACALKPSGLLDIPNALLGRFVDKLALIQRGVIYGTMRFDHGIHCRFLCASWVESILERLHLSYCLTTKAWYHTLHEKARAKPNFNVFSFHTRSQAFVGIGVGETWRVYGRNYGVSNSGICSKAWGELRSGFRRLRQIHLPAKAGSPFWKKIMDALKD